MTQVFSPVSRPVNIDGLYALVNELGRRRIRVEAENGEFRLFGFRRATALIRYFGAEPAANEVIWRAWVQLDGTVRDGSIAISREGMLRVWLDHGGA